MTEGRHRKALVAALTRGIILGAAIGGVVAFFLPLLWFYYANGLSNTGDGGPSVSVAPSLAPMGVIIGAITGGVTAWRRAALSSRDNAAAQAQGAVEIRHVELRRGLRGYRPKDVHRTLDQIADSFEVIWRRRASLMSTGADLARVKADDRNSPPTLNAEEIRQMSFPLRLYGYSVKSVDRLLAEIADSFEEVQHSLWRGDFDR